jgi:hypothetical protein
VSNKFDDPNPFKDSINPISKELSAIKKESKTANK